MSNGFDPNKFIGREYEQGLFEELLKAETSARILAIRDQGGNGKSLLLEKFQHRCRTGQPRTPVSLIALDQLHDYSPLSLIKKIIEPLSAIGITFENFDRIENARVDADFKTIRASTYFQGSNFSGASNMKISGTMTNLEHAETVNVTNATVKLTPDQERLAQDLVVRAFFNDLHTYCEKSPLVIMFDTFEKCDANLKDWIVSHFLERNFFSDSCESCLLRLVLAGKELPNFHANWSNEACESTLRVVNELGKWTKENVEECMRVHGFDSYESHELESLYGLIKMNIPPSGVVQMIQTALVMRRGQR